MINIALDIHTTNIIKIKTICVIKPMKYNFNFSFDFHKITRNQDIEDLDTHFKLMDMNFNVIERNKYINTNIRDIAYYIVYNCSGNCSSDSSDDELVYMMDINYTGYKIDHQNENVPLETHNLNFTFNKILFFSLDKTDIFRINFEMIKYKEEKGLLGLFDNFKINLKYVRSIKGKKKGFSKYII